MIDDLSFLAGGGETGALIAAHDWAATPLGPIEAWPQSLRTATSLLLRSPVPIVMLWGADGIMIYNDAYSGFAGGRHPQLLGAKVREGWSEVADFNDNVMKVGLANGTLSYKDQELTLYRHGRPEQVWMNLDYSPVHDESGRPAGVICFLNETTARMLGDAALRGSERAIRETEERYRLAVRATNDAIWDWHFATNHVLWNEALEAAYGHAPINVKPTGEWWIEHIHPEDRDRVDRSIHAAIDGTDENWSEDYRFRRADGSYADVLDRGHVIRDEAGRAVRMIGAMLDLTQQRHSQAALRESEARYRLLFDSIEAGFCVVELTFDAPDGRVDYRVVEANPAFYRQTGFPQDILRRWLRDAVPTLEEHWYEIYGRVARTGTPERFEHGSAALGRWFDVYAFRVSVSGRPRVAILFNDISARRDAEDRLRELNETLESQVAERTEERDRLWRLSEDMLARADYQGMMSAVSPAWTRVLGWAEAELLTRPYATLMHPDDMGPTLAALERMGRTGQAARFENRIATRDGNWKPIEWTVAPEAEGLNFIAVGRDLSHVKAREAELEAAQEALRQSQKMEAVGQLTGGLAHDFNNLLAGISGSLELMGTRIAQGRMGDVDRYMVAAQGATKRAASLTHRLLAFSRRQTLEPKPTDVNRLVGGMEELIRGTVGPAVAVEFVAKGGLWPTLVDPNQLENALLNLCINARDAMPDGGKLTIETANRWLDDRAARERDLPAGQYVSMCVSDNGTGMPADVIERAFDPFFTTKPIGVGTGLGLSMIYGFARQSGGQVRIYSEIGQGTMVCIYLPRHHSGEETAEVAPAAPASLAEAGETVLVIDDEPLVRMLVVDVLEDLGYTAIEAADGPQGMTVLRSDARIDLLITDVGLPNGMNGRQVADAAREVRPDLKVLFVTGYAENAVLSHGHLGPGMQVITKPFDMAVLASRIKAMIAER